MFGRGWVAHIKSGSQHQPPGSTQPRYKTVLRRHSRRESSAIAVVELQLALQVGALVDLLVSCNVLSTNEAGGLFLNPHAPLPAEVLLLDA